MLISHQGYLSAADGPSSWASQCFCGSSLGLVRSGVTVPAALPSTQTLPAPSPIPRLWDLSQPPHTLGGGGGVGGAAGTHRGVGWRGTSPGPPKGQETPAPSAPRLCQLWGACGAASTSVLSSTPSQQPHQCQASASCWGFKQAQVPASGATTPGLLMDSSPCVHTHRGIPSPPAHVPGGQLRSRTPVHTRSPPGVGGGGGQSRSRAAFAPAWHDSLPSWHRLGLLEGAIPLLSGTHAPGGPGTEQGLATGQQAKGQGGGTGKGGGRGHSWTLAPAGSQPLSLSRCSQNIGVRVTAAIGDVFVGARTRVRVRRCPGCGCKGGVWVCLHARLCTAVGIQHSAVQEGRESVCAHADVVLIYLCTQLSLRAYVCKRWSVLNVRVHICMLCIHAGKGLPASTGCNNPQPTAQTRAG